MKRSVYSLFIFLIVTLVSSEWMLLAWGKGGANPAYLQMREQIQESQVVLIGNSLVGRGVDEKALSQLLDRETVKIWSGGGQSAAWYLTLKNVVAASDKKPAAVAVFFRDTSLTRPSFRVHDEYAGYLQTLSTQDERELDRRAYQDESQPVLMRFLRDVWPAFRNRERVREKMERRLKRLVVKKLFRSRIEDYEKAAEQIFADQEMIPERHYAALQSAERSAGAKNKYDFDQQLEKSFLPLMIEETGRHDLPLIFVRMRRARDAEGRPDARLESYFRKLESYLKDRQVRYLDFSSEDRLKAEYFDHSDHFNESGKTLFTQLLADRMKEAL